MVILEDDFLGREPRNFEWHAYFLSTCLNRQLKVTSTNDHGGKPSLETILAFVFRARNVFELLRSQISPADLCMWQTHTINFIFSRVLRSPFFSLVLFLFYYLFSFLYLQFYRRKTYSSFNLLLPFFLSPICIFPRYPVLSSLTSILQTHNVVLILFVCLSYYSILFSPPSSLLYTFLLSTRFSFSILFTYTNIETLCQLPIIAKYWNIEKIRMEFFCLRLFVFLYCYHCYHLFIAHASRLRVAPDLHSPRSKYVLKTFLRYNVYSFFFLV